MPRLVVQERWEQFLAVAAENQREIEAQVSRLEYLQQLVQRLRTLRQRNEEAMLQTQEQPQEGGPLVEQLALQITDLESADRSLTHRFEECIEKLALAREQVGNRERTQRLRAVRFRTAAPIGEVCRPPKMLLWVKMFRKRNRG